VTQQQACKAWYYLLELSLKLKKNTKYLLDFWGAVQEIIMLEKIVDC